MSLYKLFTDTLTAGGKDWIWKTEKNPADSIKS
jgi:hypothetical protein